MIERRVKEIREPKRKSKEMKEIKKKIKYRNMRIIYYQGRNFLQISQKAFGNRLFTIASRKLRKSYFCIETKFLQLRAKECCTY